MNKINSWLPHEDQALLKLCQEPRIGKWAKINKTLAEQFGIIGKTPKKCRQRYNNHLNPALCKKEWTSQEEECLLTLNNNFGNKWALISRHLPGRTDNAIKNKFYSKFRLAIRNINLLGKSQSFKGFKELKIGFIYKLVTLLENKFTCSHHISQDLLTRAEHVKLDIIKYQKANAAECKQKGYQLSQLMENIQYINLQFKRKVIKKRSRTSSESSNLKCQTVQLVIPNTSTENYNVISEEKQATTGHNTDISKCKYNCQINFSSHIQKVKIIENQKYSYPYMGSWRKDEQQNIWDHSLQFSSLHNCLCSYD